MRLSDEVPMDPEIVAELQAIDATLAGEPVDPFYAELAELSVLVAGERPVIDDQFGRSLDASVGRRFEPVPAPGTPRRGWLRRPALGLAVAGVAAVAVAAVLVVQPGSSSRNGSLALSTHGISGAASSSPSRAQTATSLSAPSLSARSGKSAASGALGPSYAANGVAQSVAPTPQSNGRKITQSAQLQLLAANNRVDDVAQEVFNVVGQESGVVERSQVTAAGGNGGFASFSLSVPSANLARTISLLSQQRYARVASSTNSTQDVNGQYLSDVRSLQDARALRTSLLRQLAAATTQTEIDSLTAQIHDAEASISSDEATLRGLQHQINFSSLSVTINAGPVIGPVFTPSSGSGSGFTLSRAVHDAGRVLTVAAGVALIALATMLPVALLVALGLWIAHSVRRRRREHALDTA